MGDNLPRLNEIPVGIPKLLPPVGIELGRAYGEVEGYQPRPFGCEMGAQFHLENGKRWLNSVFLT